MSSHWRKLPLLFKEAVARRLHPIVMGWTQHPNDAEASAQYPDRTQDEKNATHSRFSLKHRVVDPAVWLLVRARPAA
jgi:hypothetical protein